MGNGSKRGSGGAKYDRRENDRQGNDRRKNDRRDNNRQEQPKGDVEASFPPPLGVKGDWTPEEFEQAGKHVLDVIRRHLQQLEHSRVLPSVGANELQQLLDGAAPEEPEDFTAILKDTETNVIPHLTQWNHPRFFAYFPVGSSGPGAVADLLASALNINGMLWKTAPAAVTLEQIVLRWMAEMVGYDPEADGTLINGASLATFYALAAAREAAGLDIREQGMTGRNLPTLRVYSSEHAHSSIDKAVIGIGAGLDNLVKIGTDATHRLDPERLEAAIKEDIKRGYRPLAVVAVVGTTSTGAVDPIDDIAEVCSKYGLWLHVDAAFGGFYNIVPSVRRQVGELHAADSLVVNPHKVLFTPLEVTAFYCKRKGALADTFSLIPPYLRTDDPDGVINPMDYTLQLGRRFNSLKVWWVIRAFGVSGLRSRMEHQLELAELLRQRMAAHPDFELLGGMGGVGGMGEKGEGAEPGRADRAPASLHAMTAGRASSGSTGTQGGSTDTSDGPPGGAPGGTPYPLVCFRAVPHKWREKSAPSTDPSTASTADSTADSAADSATAPATAEALALGSAVDRFNEALLQRVNADGRHFISHTVVAEGYILRASIGNIRTDEHHIESLWQALQAGLAGLSTELGDWL